VRKTVGGGVARFTLYEIIAAINNTYECKCSGLSGGIHQPPQAAS
jgi:hypothetical protein